jgi:tetratricopeptide (TPR) repeat protein
MTSSSNKSIVLGPVVPPSAATFVDQLRSFLPPLATTRANSSGHHVHRSITHLTRDLTRDLSPSAISGESVSNGILRDASTRSAILASMSRQRSFSTATKKCYDEGMYMYKSDIIDVTSTSTEIESEIQQKYSLAQTFIRAGNYSDAIHFFEMALSKTHQQCVQNGPLIQHCIYHNIGYCYLCCNKNDVAMTYYQMSLQAAMHHEFDNPVYASTAQNAIAVLCLKADEERQQHQQQSPVSDRDTILMDQVMILQQCHDVYVRTFGSRSKEAATILYNIGRALVCVRQYDSASEAFKQCLQIRRHNLSNDTGNNNTNDDSVDNNLTDIAVCLFKLGQIDHRVGKYDAAMASYQQFICLLGKCTTQFSHHPDVVKAFLCMAEIHTSRGNIVEAIANYEHIIDHFRDSHSGNVAHNYVVTAHIRLGDIKAKKKEYHAALRHYIKSLEMEEDLFLIQPLTNPSIITISTMFKIADMQRKLKLYCSAVNMYLRLYDIHVATSFSSMEVGRILSFIGATLSDDQNYALALEFFFDVFKLQMINYSYQDTSDAASTLNSIGLIYFLLKEFTMAELCFTESLRMNINLFGYDHYENSILWYNIASCNNEQGRDEKAVSFYEAAIRIEALHCTLRSNDFVRSAAFDNNHRFGRQQRRSNNTRALQKLGSIYEKQAELQKAKDLYLQALNIELSIQSVHNSPTIARLLNVIGNIFLQEADITPMMECYITAARLLQRWQLTASSDREDTSDCALVITGYKYYYLSRMHPPAAATA